MLSNSNGVSWMNETGEENRVIENNNNNNMNNNVVDVTSLSSLKSMLEVDSEWYNNFSTSTEVVNVNEINNNNNNNNHGSSINNNNININNNNNHNLILNTIDSSSCTPSPSVFNGATTIDNHNHASPYLFSSKSVVFNNPLNQGFGGNNGFFTDNQMSTGNGVLSGFAEFSTQTEMGGPNLGNGTQFGTPQMLHFGGGSSSGGVGDDGEGFVVGGSALASRFRGFDQGLGSNSEFGSRNSKMLKPLDTPAPGAQPTLFQKRAALRKNDGGTNSNSNVSGDMVNMSRGEGQNGKRNSGGDNEKKRKFGNVGVVLDTVSLDGSFNYDSDDFAENSNFKLSGGGGSSSGGGGDDGGKIGGGTNSNNTSTVTGGGVGDSKGKKKGMPAKNLMAERRRRKKLNDRLYMLRSVVPKISKMDRASILGDAIDYLKELLQKINDIHNELESTPPAMAHTSNFHPLTPTLPNLPPRIKEELCSSSMPSPNGQPARVEVRLREGRAVNIHMFCGRKPGLLLSTMRALDGLGLDIQQAVISCFNGFALDIFRAEQCKEGQDLHPDQVKAMLLELATFHGSALLGNGNM